MLLNSKEIHDLTGYVRPSDQIRWFKDHGWPFEIGGDKRPKVLRSVMVARLGGTTQNDEPSLRLDHEAA